MSKSSKVLRAIRILLVTGCIAVLAIKATQMRSGISGEELFEASPVWTAIILIAASSFFIALLILFPIFIFFKSHEMQTTDGVPMPWWAPISIVTGINTNPNWLIPKTVSTPLVVIMAILGGFVTYTLVASLIFGFFLK